MKFPVAFVLAASVLTVSSSAFAQSPIVVSYCQELAKSYRQAYLSGKPSVPGAGQASANCPTNPDNSIPTLEGALMSMQIPLPQR